MGTRTREKTAMMDALISAHVEQGPPHEGGQRRGVHARQPGYIGPLDLSRLSVAKSRREKDREGRQTVWIHGPNLTGSALCRMHTHMNMMYKYSINYTTRTAHSTPQDKDLELWTRRLLVSRTPNEARALAAQSLCLLHSELAVLALSNCIQLKACLNACMHASTLLFFRMETWSVLVSIQWGVMSSGNIKRQSLG